MENIVTAKELASLLKLTEATIYKLVSTGNLPGFKIGDSWRFEIDKIRKLFRGKLYLWIFGLKPLKVEVEAGVPPMEQPRVLLTRILGHTIPGYEGLEIGLSSLGVRAQALRLQPFNPEHLQERDSFLPPEISFEQARSRRKVLPTYFSRPRS